MTTLEGDHGNARPKRLTEHKKRRMSIKEQNEEREGGVRKAWLANLAQQCKVG